MLQTKPKPPPQHVNTTNHPFTIYICKSTTTCTFYVSSCTRSARSRLFLMALIKSN